jgi:hypothetical protein
VSDLVAFIGQLHVYLRDPADWDHSTVPPTPIFVPPLTTAEQATFDDLVKMTRFGLATSLSLAEYQAMKPDLALGEAFLGIASPTNAQAVAAEKAIIRVLGALLRDQT